MRTPRNDRLSDKDDVTQTGREKTPGRETKSGKRQTLRDTQRKQADGATSPERRCILSGEHEARDGLIRLAISPDGVVLPDVLARAPGRGAWIGVTRSELEAAMAKGKLKGALARAFKGAALSIPEDLPGMIEGALIRAVTDRLGLEMRSGKLLTGSDRIAEHARGGMVTWLAHAADAAPDGSRKLDQAWRVGREAEGSGLTGVTLPLDRAALSVALGRENVVHLALTESSAAKRLDVPLSRLLHFLSRPDDVGPPGLTDGSKPDNTGDGNSGDPDAGPGDTGQIDEPGPPGAVGHDEEGHAPGETQRSAMTTTIQD
ncbi:DUF448 domain-containing protein [Novosphingobium rosa]|uniref:DUF448 domain-containing protein n=1 Tax=Novosphingobium rosa TaxID=76978 RepID=UPI000A011A80|nr:DUF448 domain-containing protein [Novosphingobium rosa]